MPVFSCGGMRYQHAWKDVPESEIPEANQANLEATIRRALEAGVNHIETARGYGTSEMQLGRILPALPREKIIVQTKVSPFEDSEKFLRTFDRSMEYLKLDRVDLLALHGINTPELLEWSIRPGGCLDAARKIQAQGRARFIGFSTHAPTSIILQAIETGEFDYVNLHWYFIFQQNWAAVEAARRHDMGVFIISPSDKGGKLYDPPSRLVELCKPLSPIVFNDLFCLARPEVHTLSVGAARPSDFDEHLKTLPHLAEAERVLAPIVDRLEAAARQTLGEAWLRTWREGLPSPDETPGKINIPVMLWLRNLALAWDMLDYGKMRYNMFGNGGHWFPGEKPNNLETLDFSACLATSPHAKEIPGLLAETQKLLAGGDVKRLSQS